VGNQARLEALIDSPSLSGHIDLRLLPGTETEAEISVTLFPRATSPTSAWRR
jgi:periplasmic glucans biosynthesis protein